MAIQISGTQVISNSRGLTNIASVDAATVTAFGNAGVGGAPAFAWDPTTTPDVTLSSSGTWSKPGSLDDNQWVVFYMVGGGAGGAQGGSWSMQGTGANGYVFSGLAGELASSISFTVGAGATGSTSATPTDGNATTCTIATGIVYVAEGGVGVFETEYTVPDGSGGLIAPAPTNPVYGINTLGTPPPTQGGGGQTTDGTIRGFPSGFGGGGGSTQWNNFQAPNGGNSLYAGNGGDANSSGKNGDVPGGGGAGMNSERGGNGGNGSVRIWYV